MTTREERDQLRALAEVVPMPDTDPDIIERWYQDADLVCHPVSRVADRAFIAAVSPDVVLSLLDALDAAEAERDALRARLEAASDALDNLVCVSLYEGFDSPRLRHHVELIALALDPADESGAPS